LFYVFVIPFFSFVFFIFLLKVVTPIPESTTPQRELPSSETPAGDLTKSEGCDSAAQVEPLLADALVQKYDKESSNICDVKIGDGMDITIHGENG